MVCIGFHKQSSRYVPAFNGSTVHMFPGLHFRGWMTLALPMRVENSWRALAEGCMGPDAAPLRRLAGTNNPKPE